MSCPLTASESSRLYFEMRLWKHTAFSPHHPALSGALPGSSALLVLTFRPTWINETSYGGMSEAPPPPQQLTFCRLFETLLARDVRVWDKICFFLFCHVAHIVTIFKCMLQKRIHWPHFPKSMSSFLIHTSTTCKPLAHFSNVNTLISKLLKTQLLHFWPILLTYTSVSQNKVKTCCSTMQYLWYAYLHLYEEWFKFQR